MNLIYIFSTAWGDLGTITGSTELAFDNDGGFDNFLALSEPPPVPQSTPAKYQDSYDEQEEKDDNTELSVVIRLEMATGYCDHGALLAAIARPIVVLIR